MTGVYNPKAFILHAASLHQGFPHCEKFSTAATRRCLDRVSVPVWLVVLSDQLPVDSLGEPLPRQLADRPRAPLKAPGCPGFTPNCFEAICGINSPFGELSPTFRQIVSRVTHPFATGLIPYCYRN